MKRSGFTLIEVLVAMSIFGLIVALASMSFTNIFRQNARLNAQRHLQEDSNYLMEKIVKEVRNGSVDFASHHIANNFVGGGALNCPTDTVCYQSYLALHNDTDSPPSVTNTGEETLYLLSADGISRTVLALANSNINLVRQTLEPEDPFDASKGNWICTPDYLAVDNSCKFDNYLAPENIAVTNLKFIISPIRDPYKFSRVENLQTQPTVTIILETQLTGTFSSDLFPNGMPKLTLQTTVTSRYYNTINWLASA